MNDLKDVIASERFDIITANGYSFQCHFKLFRPKQVDEDWQCPVHMDGVYDNIHYIWGVSSLQSMMLALRSALFCLEGFIERGGQLFETESNEPVSLDYLREIFSADEWKLTSDSESE